MKKLALLSFILILLPAFLSAQDQDLKSRFYDGITAEEIEGDLDKAINIFQDILNAEDVDRQLAARCLYHIGLCHDKKESGQAMKFYTSLLEKYPDQGDLADLARNRITKLEDANTFIDPRDGHKYKWVKIGNQIWMAENLAYMPWVNPPKKQEFGIWVYDYEGEDVAEAKATENYQKYGCLYDWPTAMALSPEYLEKEWGGDPENHQGLCPPGWRMPSDDDWTELEKLLGLTEKEINEIEKDPRYGGWRDGCGALKLKSSADWISDGYGNNELGLSLLPSGLRLNNLSKFLLFDELGRTSYCWTSQKFDYKANSILMGIEDDPSAFSRYFMGLNRGQSDDAIHRGPFHGHYGMSVRCIKSDNPSQSDQKSYLEKIKFSAKGNVSFDPGYISIVPEIIGKINLQEAPQAYYFQYVVNGDNLIIWKNTDSIIRAYNTNDLSLVWERKEAISYKNGLISNFVEDGDNLTFSSKRGIVTISAKTGKEIGSIDYPEVVIMPLNNADKIIAKNLSSYSNSFYGIDKKTGTKLWDFRLGDSLSFSDPVSDGKLLYFGVRPYFKIQQEFLKKSNALFCALNINTGELVWSADAKGMASYRSPLIIDDMVIFMNYKDQYVYCLNKYSGELNWKYYMDHTGSSNIITMDEKLFFLDNRFLWGTSKVYAIDLEGKEIWKKNLPEDMSTRSIFNSNDSHLFVQVRTTEESNIIILDQKKDGKNYIMNLPLRSIEESIITKDKIIVPTNDGIYIYKYPDFE